MEIEHIDIDKRNNFIYLTDGTVIFKRRVVVKASDNPLTQDEELITALCDIIGEKKQDKPQQDIK